LFPLRTADFQAVIEHYNLRTYFYTDDDQINGSAKLSVVPQLQSQLLDGIDEIAGCTCCNSLQLGTTKTKIMWCSTGRRQHQLPTTAVRVGGAFVAPSHSYLRSAFSFELMVPRTRLSTVDNRAFPVAAARIWNSLPSDITRAETLRTFKNRLKTFFFRISYALFCFTSFFCIARLL
jgi:hypothetical protein